MKPPTAESYWVNEQVLAGKYPGAKVEAPAVEKIAALLAAGVRTFVDLTEQGELLPYAHLLPPDVAHHCVPIADVTAPSGKRVRAALEAIELGCSSGVVYVHCWGGCGRTGVVVGCYLVEQGWAADDALARVYDLTRGLQSKPCPETSAQKAVVHKWDPQRAGHASRTGAAHDTSAPEKEADSALASSPDPGPVIGKVDGAGAAESPPTRADSHEMSTAALRSSEIPDPEESFQLDPRTFEPSPIMEFAFSYPIPASLQPFHELVTRAAFDQWRKSGDLPGVGLDGLRFVLSGMASLWRHCGAQGKQGQPKYASEESFIRALVKQIRLEVWQEEQWWWQPSHTPTSDERRAMALQRSPETRALSKLYELAAALVDDAIQQRDIGAEEPLNLPLLTYLPDDPVATERKYLAYLVMRGLAEVDPSSTLEGLRDALLDRTLDYTPTFELGTSRSDQANGGAD